MRITLFFLVLVLVFQGYTQKTIVTGKVIEAETGIPIPFANVIFTGTQEGTITDFDGNFRAETVNQIDSIEVRYVGFIRRSKELIRGSTQVINFQMQEDVLNLNELIFYAGENPAFQILREVVKRKQSNDKRSLGAYEYESYTKIEFDVDNMSDNFRKGKVIQKITQVLDSIEQIAGEDGNPILPVFLSEAISRYYFRNDPILRRENILKTKISGIGITDGTLTSQVIGSTFQEYNFYQNWLNVVEKEFVSPIADGWKLFYEYDLNDSLMIDDDFCYQIDFFPKREQDLAFWGKMWITKEHFALKRIDAFVPKMANLNYIEKIKIQQDLIQTASGPWLPEKTRVLLDISQLSKTSAGLLAKFYVSTKDHVVNEPKEKAFYLEAVSMETNVREESEEYWEASRHDALTSTEVHVFQMIDTLKKIPIVHTLTEIMKFTSTGYIKSGKLDIGPYTTFFGNNDIEGVRLGFGARTNLDFSNVWVLGGHFGYGFDDHQWKYKYHVTRIIDRKPWTTVKYEQQRELEQVWLLNQNIEPNSFFYTYSRFGNLTEPFMIRKYRSIFSTQLSAGLNSTIAFKHQTQNPYFDFNYFVDESLTQTASNYEVSEASISIRYAKDEILVVNDNERLSLGIVKWPAIDLDYTYGFKDVLGSDFKYHKLKLSIEKKQKMGLVGTSTLRVTGGKIFGDIPYTLLYNPIGNESPVYVGFAFNLMNYFEFSSDQYMDVRYRHSFEGFILNRIPLMKKLKWRLIGSANALVGSIRDENVARVQYPTDINGDEIIPFTKLDSGPYVEVGYGVENILKIFSVEAFHRLTYLDNPNVNRFGVKFSIQFKL